MKTHEKLTLKGAAMLVWSEDETACKVVLQREEDVEPEILSLEDLFSLSLWKNPISNNEYVYHGSAPGGLPRNLDMLSSVFHVCKVAIPLVSDTEAKIEMSCYAMKWKRCTGLFIYWGMLKFYTEMGLTSYKGHASKWAYNKEPDWQKLLKDWFRRGEHVLLSRHLLRATKSMEVPFRLRCLPQVGVDTPKFVGMVHNWGYNRVNVGGFRDPAARRKMCFLFQGLMSELCSTTLQHATYPLYLSTQWQCDWPRPISWEVQQMPKCSFGLCMWDSVAIVQLTFAEEGPDSVAFKRFLKAKSQMADDCTMPLHKLLLACHGHRLYESVWAQTLLILSTALEALLSDIQKHKVGPELQTKMTFEVLSACVEPGANDMYEKLHQYIENCKEHHKQHSKCFTLICDKATPAGGTVMNGCLTYPDNVCIILPPQESKNKQYFQPIENDPAPPPDPPLPP